jgi:hypothetical protein
MSIIKTTRAVSRWRLAPIGALLLATQVSAIAQPAGCTFSPDERNPSEKILRCGESLTVRNTPNSSFGPLGENTPHGIQLDSGALMIEFNPTPAQKDFQILTPHAIAAVRGTKWVVEVGARRTSTLVLTGAVEVRRPSARRGVIVRAGQGVDVAAKGPIVVKRWAKKRVDALLARFGQ